MALQSKSITANGSKGHHKFTLNVVENSTNLNDNTSSVFWSLVLSPIQTGWDWRYSATVPVTYTVTINGSVYSGNIMNYDGSSTITVGSGTLSVSHNSDGNKSISYSFSISSLNYSYLPGSASASGSMSLTFIARKSVPSVSVSSINFGKSITISTNRKSDNFTHRLYYRYGSVSWIEITTSASVGTSYVWTIPLSLMNQIPSASSLYITICCSTYNGSNWIGEDYAYVTATVPTTSDCYPSIGGISWTKTSSEPSTWPMTQNVSKGTLTMTNVSGAYGSTIKSYSLTFAGLGSASSSLTVDNIASSGTLKAVATVTDSRGRSTTKEVSFTVSAYSPPVLTATVYRSDSSGVEDDSGDYLYVRASATVTAVGDNALQSLVLQYKKHTASAYAPPVTLTSGTAKIIAASSDYTWDWVVTATDKVRSVSDNNSISTGEVVLDFLANGKGIGLGKVAEREGLDSAWDFMKNGITQTDYVVAQGTSGAWTYRKWASGISECWRTTASTTVTFGGTVGLGCWYATTSPAFAFPAEAGFIEVPVVTQNCNSGGAIIVSSITSVTTTQVKLTYGRFYGGNDDYNVTFHIHAYGKWK